MSARILVFDAAPANVRLLEYPLRGADLARGAISSRDERWRTAGDRAGVALSS